MTKSSLLPWLLVASACEGAAEPPVRRTVFDPTASGVNVAPVEVTANANEQLESPYPPLDRAEVRGGPMWTGVTVVRRGVRLSRPSQWMIRDASLDPGHAYIVYVSPKGYSFGIYERSDSPTDLWRDVEQRYEDDVAAAGAKVVGRRVAMATGSNQGRAYTIERKAPLPSRSREILLRSDHRIVLVQVVSQDPDLSRFSGELLEVLDHLEVL